MTDLRILDPMCADGVSEKDLHKLWVDPDWVAEEKFDGSRYLMHVTATGNRFTSRHRSASDGMPVEKTDNVPHLRDQGFSFLDGTVLDGEIIAPNSDFGSTVSVMGSKPEKALAKQQQSGFVQYKVFDILYHKGDNVMGESLATRRGLLNAVFAQALAKGVLAEQMSLVRQEKSDKEAFYHEIVKGGGEGIILKNLAARYVTGARNRDTWAKVKKYITDDVVIIGYTQGNGKYADTIGAVRFGKWKNGDLVELGQTSGMDDATRRMFGMNQTEYLGRVMEIGAMEQLKSGAYRHPRFIRMRPDKESLSCQIV